MRLISLICEVIRVAEYIGVRLSDELVIKKLYTVHYYEYSKKYSFPGEQHNFWEFVYADKGEVYAVADDTHHLLKQGTIIFHKPGEWHTVYANGTSAPNIAIVTFECTSDKMKFFENKILTVGQEQKSLISKIIAEYTNAFSTALNDPYTNKLARRRDAAVCSEQLIKLYLCELLISFLRSSPETEQRAAFTINHTNSAVDMLVNYMKENITGSITLRELADYSGTNRTAIENIFRDSFGMGAVEYFLRLKIELAKKYLREDNYNVTQIAEILGYSGVHYFSRQFKRMSGMTPTQYSMSIKAMMRENIDGI